MDLKSINKMAKEIAKTSNNQTITLDSLKGLQPARPLPPGVFECKLSAIPVKPDSSVLRIIAETW